MHLTVTERRKPFTAGVAPRIMHLIDAENLNGSPRFSLSQARGVRRAYAAVAPAGPSDMTIFATSHLSAPQAWMAWPSATRRLVRSGADGADLTLLTVIDSECLHLR